MSLASSSNANAPGRDYLDPVTLAAIGSLELRARMIVEGLMIGMHRSPAQGFSAEFAQHRQYAPGDDLRHLDWKVFGRTDKLYLKQYQKETNLDLMVLVDTSGSMGYQSDAAPWRKYDAAASLAAALAYLALRQQDRVAVALFTDRLHAQTRLSNAHDHWRSVVNVLNSAAGSVQQNPDDPEGRATDLVRLFDQLTAKLTRRTLIVLVSDLFDQIDTLEHGLARLHHRRHGVILLQTLDPAEQTFPFRSPSQFVGLEGEGRLNLDPAALRKAYLEVFHEHQQGVQNLARRYSFDHLLVDTALPIGPALSHYLAHRAASVRRRGTR